MQKRVELNNCGALKIIAIACLIIISSNAISHAQSPASNSAGITTIRIDIGQDGLHCPFLGPKIKEELHKRFPAMTNLFVDEKASYLTFDIPESELIDEDDIANIAVKAGYPASQVKVEIQTKSDETPKMR